MHQTILIIDDDPAIRQMLEQALTFVGYVVRSTDDPATALGLLREMTPELILCDVLMSPMDGVEFCSIVATLPSHQHLPVVLMSGIEDMTLYEGTQAAAFLAKPFELNTLFSTIEQVLASYQASGTSTSNS